MSKLDLARTLFLYLSKKICNIYVKNIMLMFNFRHFRHIFCTFRHIFLPKLAILTKLMLNLDIYFSILQHIYSRICQGYSGVYGGIQRYTEVYKDTKGYRGIQKGTHNGTRVYIGIQRRVQRRYKEVWHPKPPLATLGGTSIRYGGLWDTQKPNKNRTYQKYLLL